MKDTIKAMGIGVVIGLGAMVVVQVLSNEDFQEALKSTIKLVERKTKEGVESMNEDAMLQKARLTKDPGVNQKWVEDQWDAVI